MVTPAYLHPPCRKDQCSSPSRKEQKRAQYRQVKAHMQKEDGRVTAHGWSLPSKFKVGPGFGVSGAELLNLNHKLGHGLFGQF